nr:GNAT family N-acetyltransferase [Nocardioides daedukensis]
MSGTAQDYFARRSKTFLKRVRKQQRRLEASGVRCRRVSPEEVGPALDRFTELHAVREDRAELLQEMSRIRRAAEAGAAVGEVEFYVAEHEGVWGAVLMNFVVGGRLNVYQTARSFDPIFNHVGSVIDTLAIEDACSAALVEVDFLRGAEPFKRSFAASERDLLRFRSGHGVRGRMALAVLVGGTSLRSAVGRQWRRMVQKKSSGSDGSSGSLRALVGHVQSWKRPR